MLDLCLQMYVNGITIVDTGLKYIQSLCKNPGAGIALYQHQDLNNAYFTGLEWCTNVQQLYLQLQMCTNGITIIDTGLEHKQSLYENLDAGVT